MKKLKSNIGWLIEKSDYNREFLSKRYGKSRNTISNWCTGKSYPSTIELFDLALLLNCEVGELYDRLEEEA
ncbi:helix-turn-helix domain-containing protein [Metabacillus fastidiosus]|uniref:helix-turn-helix domain-containing protein n=1 Tax=Metabacillus fastidiosus TaxID=1458 RepID=UPI0008241B22|nr:helix-turn-helix transcriptional regulator [Metabacillus fastidiosus]MED4462663.1 helix-turn-helix transcriptional regulator [Metabacillus fastidiosus]